MTKRPERQPLVVGVSDHGGWAVLVSATATDGEPAVVDRRRVSIIAPGIPTQPYHHDTLAMPDAESERLLRTVKKSIAACTARAFERLSADLEPPYRVMAIAIREPPLPELPATVKEAHASYYVQCRADGMLYHSAICTAAEERGWKVVQHRRGDELGKAAGALGTTAGEVERFLHGLKTRLKAPWSAEHRDAFAAAIGVLGDCAPLRRTRA